MKVVLGAEVVTQVARPLIDCDGRDPDASSLAWPLASTVLPSGMYASRFFDTGLTTAARCASVSTPALRSTPCVWRNPS